MARWTYLIADTRTNIIIDELPLTKVRFTKVLNGSGQLQASLALGDSRLSAHDVYELTRPVRRVVYAVRDRRPIWGGIIWAAGYDSATAEVQIGAADWWSYFDHRVVLPVLTLPPATPTYVAGLGTIYTSQEQNAIARSLVTVAQGHTAGDIGVDVDGAVSGTNRAITYNGYDLNYVGDALRSLAGIADGPDICFDVGDFDSSGRPTRLMRTGTPRLEQTGDAHTWDYGGNLLSFKWSSAGGVMATRAYAEGAGEDTGTQFAVASDTTLYDTGWPLLETDDIYSDQQYAALVTLADTLLDGGRLPSVAVSLKVRGDLAPVVGEVAVGDTGNLVIPPDRDPFLVAGISLGLRVATIAVGVDDNGVEDVELTCITTEEVV